MAAEIRRSIERPAATFEEVVSVARVARETALPLLKELHNEFATVRGEQGSAKAARLDLALADADAGHIEPESLSWSMSEPPDTIEIGPDIRFGVGITDLRLLNRTVEVSASGPDLGKVLAMHEALRRAFEAEDETLAAKKRAADAVERHRSEQARARRWPARFWQQSPTMVAGIVSGVSTGLVVGIVMLFIGIAVGHH